MWPVALSGRLLIVALVGRYPANWLIRRGSIPYHRSFSHRTMRYCALMRYYQPFPAAIPQYKAGYPRVTHPSATQSQNRHPEGIVVKCFVRLACVKHAASVHPEPGSNSHKKFLSFQNPLAEYPFPSYFKAKGSHLLSRCIFRCCSLNYSL